MQWRIVQLQNFDALNPIFRWSKRNMKNSCVYLLLLNWSHKMKCLFKKFLIHLYVVGFFTVKCRIDLWNSDLSNLAGKRSLEG